MNEKLERSYKKGCKLNKYKTVTIKGERVVKVYTTGKRSIVGIVDYDLWHSYLKNFIWTGLTKNGQNMLQTSIKSISMSMQKVIINYLHDEIDTCDMVIDHINGNSTDNRVNNLRLVNSKINAINTKSTKTKCGYFMPSGNRCFQFSGPNGIVSKTFFAKNYSSVKLMEKDIQKYYNEVVVPIKEEQIVTEMKKLRDNRFEQGLRLKIQNQEYDEIKTILQKYGLKVKGVTK